MDYIRGKDITLRPLSELLSYLDRYLLTAKNYHCSSFVDYVSSLTEEQKGELAKEVSLLIATYYYDYRSGDYVPLSTFQEEALSVGPIIYVLRTKLKLSWKKIGEELDITRPKVTRLYQELTTNHYQEEESRNKDLYGIF